MNILNYSRRLPIKTKSFVLINLIAGFLFLIGYFLSLINIPYFLYFLGLIAFFTPGYNIASIFEQITNITQGRLKILLWTIILSFAFNPLIVYTLSLYSGRLISSDFALLGFAIYWVLSFLLLVFFYLWKHHSPTDLSLKWKADRSGLTALSILLAALLVNFFLYRYIPEADGYGCLIKVKNIFANPNTNWISTESRPLFISLTIFLTYVTKISPYWIYKFLLPIIISLTWSFVFIGLSSPIKNFYLKIYASLSFYIFPVIIIELFIIRPQSIFTLFLPIILFLSQDIIRTRKTNFNPYNFFWFLVLLVVSIICTKIHELFIFAIIFVILGLVTFLFDKIKKYLLESVLITSFIIMGAYPWLSQVGFIDLFIHFLEPFCNAIVHPKFDLWFINGYINVDSNEMGWPNYTWILYYFYNLGFSLIFFIPLLFLKRKGITLKFRDYSIYLIGFFIFFSIAEIFPRLGLAYLPDRAWLLAVLSISPIIPSLIDKLEMADTKISLNKTIAFLLIISISSSLLITYLKKGWTTPNDFKVIEFFNNKKEDDAIILIQGVSRPIIKYLTNYQPLIPNEEFIESSDKKYIELMINGENDAQKSALTNQSKTLEKEIEKNISDYLSSESSKQQRERAIGKLNENNQKLNEINQKLNDIQALFKNFDINTSPIYFYYSLDKFDTIYTKRKWWRDYNFYHLNIDLFNKNFPLIYSDKDLYIWKIN